MKILDIALKDLTRSFRNAFAIGMTIVAPLLLIGLISLAFGGASSGSSDLPDVSVGIYNADQLSDTTILKQSLGYEIRNMFFDESVQSWIYAQDYTDETDLRTELDERKIGVAIIIPANFSDQVLAGSRVSKVTIISDPTLSVTPQVIENMVSAMLDGVAGGGIAVETIMERQQTTGFQSDLNNIPGLISRYSDWYSDFQRNLFHQPDQAALVMTSSTTQSSTDNPMQKMLGFMMAGQMIFFAFFTGSYSMMSILQENEEGTLARMFALPMTRTSVLTGKLLAVVLMVIVQGIVLLIAAHFIFGIEWGNPGMVVLALLGQVLAASGLGVFLISFVKSSRQAGPVMGGGLTALGMLGGLFTANIPMPEAFNKLAIFTPQGWVIRGWKVVLNAQNFSDLLLPVVVCGSIGLILFTIGALRFKKRFA